MLIPVFLFEIKDEDDRAFMANLYQSYYPMMLHAAIRILHDENSADDIVNDAFVNLFCKISVLRGLDVCTLRAYLVSTVRNLSITALRKRNKQNQYAFWDDGTALDWVISEDASPMDVVLRNAEIESLIAGLRKLPERDRWLLEMKYFRRMRDAEIAQQLEIRENSVRMYLTKARRKLGELIAEDEQDP